MKAKDLVTHGLSFMVRQLIDSERVVFELHTQRHPQQHRQRRNVPVEWCSDKTWIFPKGGTKQNLPCFVCFVCSCILCICFRVFLFGTNALAFFHRGKPIGHSSTEAQRVAC